MVVGVSTEGSEVTPHGKLATYARVAFHEEVVIMPVKIRKVDGYRVTHSGKVSAKSTTKRKAEAQAHLLRGVAHGWKPTGKPARKRK